MTLLDRLLAHDAWTTGALLEQCAGLTNEELDREFDIGPRSVRATLEHIIRNMEVWTDLMRGREVGPRGGGELSDLRVRLDRAAADLADLATDVERRRAWDERWMDVLDDPPKEKSHGGAIAHVLTHGMHHRAQLLYMLRRLGLQHLPEGDVLSWESSARGA